MLNWAWCAVCYISFRSVFWADFKYIKYIEIYWAHRFLWRFMFWAVKMTIFDKNMKVRSCDAFLHSKSIAYENSIGFALKLYHWRHLAMKIIFFFINFTNDVIMTGSDQSPRIHARTLSMIDNLVIWVKDKIIEVSLELTLIIETNWRHYYS